MMSTGAAAPLEALSSSPARRLVITAAAFMLLLQALFVIPLALRMTADALQWSQFSALICATTTDGAAPVNDPRPSHPLPSHDHGQCLVCHHALPLGLLAAVLCVLAARFGQPTPRHKGASAPAWRRDPRHFYQSRAPPAAA